MKKIILFTTLLLICVYFINNGKCQPVENINKINGSNQCIKECPVEGFNKNEFINKLKSIKQVGNIAIIPTNNKYILLQSVTMNKEDKKTINLINNIKKYGGKNDVTPISSLDLILIESSNNVSITMNENYFKKDFVNVCNKDLEFDVLSKAVEGLKNYLSFLLKMTLNAKNDRSGEIGDAVNANIMVKLITIINEYKYSKQSLTRNFICFFLNYLKTDSNFISNVDKDIKNLTNDLFQLIKPNIEIKGINSKSIIQAIRWARYTFHTEAQFIYIKDNKSVKKKFNIELGNHFDFISLKNPCHSCQNIQWVIDSKKNNNNFSFLKSDTDYKQQCKNNNDNEWKLWL